MQKIFLVALTIFITSLLQADAKAQFRGDIFFEVPSVSAEPGETVSLNIAAFTGVDVVGAADLVVSFDEAEFSLQSVVFPDGITGLSKVTRENGIARVRIIAANGVSLTAPSGVATFVTVTGDVLAQPGALINIDTQNRQVLLSDRTDITNDGLSAEISVANSTSNSNLKVHDSYQKQTLTAYPGTDLYKRAIRISANRGVVTLAQPDGSYVDVILLNAEN